MKEQERAAGQVLERDLEREPWDLSQDRVQVCSCPRNTSHIREILNTSYWEDSIDKIETNFPSIGMFGLFAYPFLGMYKSISTSSLSPSQRKILLARQVYGSYMARQREYAAQDGGQERDEATQNIVLEAFERSFKRG